MKNTATVLITGSLGYIGSRLTEYLGDAGYRCVGHDTGFFRECLLYDHQVTTTIFKDVRDLAESDLVNVDSVVHLAGISNDPFGHLKPEKIYDPTREYALRLARLCKKLRIQFIFASSCSVYGIGSGLVTEQSPTHPLTPYSLNKLQIEGDLKQVSDGTFAPVIFRFATVYGLSPRIRFDVVVNMFSAMAFTTGKIILNSDGRAWRPHVHIDDVCKSIMLAVNRRHNIREPLILNVGDTSQNLQILEVAELVRSVVQNSEVVFLKNSSETVRDDEAELIRDRKVQDGVDSRTYRVSFELIQEKLPGFTCDWTVETGIRQMISRFDGIGLSSNHFNNVNFFRLQKMESLLKEGLLTEELFWSSRAHVPN